MHLGSIYGRAFGGLSGRPVCAGLRVEKTTRAQPRWGRGHGCAAAGVVAVAAPHPSACDAGGGGRARRRCRCSGGRGWAAPPHQRLVPTPLPPRERERGCIGPRGIGSSPLSAVPCACRSRRPSPPSTWAELLSVAKRPRSPFRHREGGRTPPHHTPPPTSYTSPRIIHLSRFPLKRQTASAARVRAVLTPSTLRSTFRSTPPIPPLRPYDRLWRFSRGSAIKKRYVSDELARPMSAGSRSGEADDLVQL